MSVIIQKLPYLLFSSLLLSAPIGHAETNTTEQSSETIEQEDAFSFSFDDIAENIVYIQSTNAGKTEQCCGFIVMMGDKPYLVTKQKFILGSDRLNFTSPTARIIKPRSIELSTTRDLVRLALQDGSGLEMEHTFSMNDPIAVFGIAAGKDGNDVLKGSINGVGAEIFEVSAEFEAENSGAPIITPACKVIGIASYAKESNAHAMKKGTRFENSSRRFCNRINETQWKAVNWKRFNQQFGKAYHSNDVFINHLVAILNSWADQPLHTVQVDTAPRSPLASWLESHNTVVSKSVGTGGNRREFYSNYSESADKLSSLCRTRSRELYKLAEQRGITDFLLDELESQASALDYLANIIERYGSSTYH